jgi:hypothetical protein
LENLGIDGRIILEWIFKKWEADMGWFDVARNRDRWRAFVNEPSGSIKCLAKDPVAPHEELFSVQLVINYHTVYNNCM